MEFIQNSGPGTRLEQLNKAAVQEAESVIAAIAYVTDIQTLIAACWKHQKPLTLFARYDYSGPISDEVLQWFLSKGAESANYQMRLIGDIFHPKVIWWRGVGAYIGSANLTKSAWAGNVEAGVYLTEQELDDNGMRSDVESFLAQVRSISYLLTEEYADDLIKSGTGAFANAQATAGRQFNQFRHLPVQHSLVSITRRSAADKSRDKFLKEWSNTLQILRDIGNRVILLENTPRWMPPNVSPGVAADQFLHAYYYNKVRDGQFYPYRELGKLHESNREAALQETIEWWRNLPSALSGEDDHVNNWAPLVRKLLTQGSLRQMSETQFEELCLHVHAIRDHARQVASTTLGLKFGMTHMSKEDRTKVFAKYLFSQRSEDGSTCCEIIDFVLYGGPVNDIPNRIFSACFGDPNKKIPHLGLSALGEMVGWALPDDFPPRNGRTSKALTALGYIVDIHSE